MNTHKKINITIIILSGVAIFLQTLIVSIQSLYELKYLQLVIAVLNAVLVAVQTVQLNLKKIRSGASSTVEPATPASIDAGVTRNAVTAVTA